jgi:DNA-binding NtrC family response regulator
MKHVSALPVLLVDDNPQVLHSASIVLRTSGVAHVITVEDSRAVMPLLAEQEVGVLVLDLTMPHIAGHALMEQVAGESALQSSCANNPGSGSLEPGLFCQLGSRCPHLPA